MYRLLRSRHIVQFVRLKSLKASKKSPKKTPMALPDMATEKVIRLMFIELTLLFLDQSVAEEFAG